MSAAAKKAVVRKHSAWKGLVLLLIALSSFSVLDTTSKRVLEDVPALMAVWVLFAIQVVVIGGYALIARGPASLHTHKLGLHLGRGALLGSMQVFAFYSLIYLPVGEYTALAMTTPLFVTLLASRFLGDHVSPMRLLLVVGGLVGTLVIVRPGSGTMGWAVLLPMGLVVINTAYQLLTSKMARTEDAITTLTYTTGTAVLLASVPLYWFWKPIDDLDLWLGLLLMGLSAAFGNLLFILAFERAPAATLMPYQYLQIGTGIFGGWLMFDHVPDFWASVGMGLIALFGVAGGLLTLHEKRLHRPPLQAGSQA